MKKAATPFTILIALIWFFSFHPTNLGGPASYIIVSGISMEPTYHTGDLVVLHRQADYQIGDAVAYRTDKGNVIHRIVGGSADGFILRGDNKTSDDPWSPTAADILGKEWLYIPNAGRVLQNLRQPYSMAGISLLGLLVLWEDFQPVRSSKRRKQLLTLKRFALLKKSGQSSLLASTPASIKPPSWAANLLYFSGLVTVLLLALAFYSFRQPPTETKTVSMLSLEQQLSYEYTVQTAVSELYPKGQVGPVGAGGAAQSSPAIFTRLARQIDVDYNYSLTGAEGAQLTGLVTPTMRIMSGENLLLSLPAGEPTAFDGLAVSGRMSLDLADLQTRLAALETEIGYSGGSYTVALAPTIQVQGQASGAQVDLTFAQPFQIYWNGSQITFDSELIRSEPKSYDQTVTLPRQIGLGRINLPVENARRIGLLGGALAALLAGAVAGFTYLGWGRGPAGQIYARYQHQIVSVQHADLSAFQTVQLNSMADLSKIAQKENSLILHQPQEGGHLFFVPVGSVNYIYLVREVAEG